MTDTEKLERLRDIMRPIFTYFHALQNGHEEFLTGNQKAAKKHTDKVQEMDEVVQKYLPEIQGLIFGDGNFARGTWRMFDVEQIAKAQALITVGLTMKEYPLINRKEQLKQMFDAFYEDILKNDSFRKAAKEFDKLMK